MTAEQKLGVLFAMGTATFWGLYGPALGNARVKGETPFKVYIFIGLAYLVWGIIGGAIMTRVTGGNFVFKQNMITWGFIAGSLGAFGALCLTFAMFKAKNAGLVMPVVFGGATSIAAIASIIQHKTYNNIDYRQILGFVFVVIGVVLIQMFTAHGPVHAKSTTDGAAEHPVSENSENPYEPPATQP